MPRPATRRRNTLRLPGRTGTLARDRAAQEGLTVQAYVERLIHRDVVGLILGGSVLPWRK